MSSRNVEVRSQIKQILQEKKELLEEKMNNIRED